MDNALSDVAPVSRRAAREAAAWLVRTQSGEASPVDLQAWRADAAENERAWQRALLLCERLGRIPAALGLPALDRAADPGRRAALKTLALLIAAGPLGWAAYRAAPWQPWFSDHRTVVGERREVTLEDGTQLHLNTASAVELMFDDQLRLLRLIEGEVLIRTAADARPFIVRTAEGRIRALGTRFSVRQQAGESRVAVFEHAVEVRPEDAPGVARLLRAGEQARYTRHSVGEPLPAGEQHIGWTRGVLYADRMRLDNFLAELDRHRPGLLRCDPAIADLRISGAFQLHDPEQVLTVLTMTLPVRLVYRTRYWATLVPAA